MTWILAAALLLLAALILESGLLAYAMYVLLGLIVLSRLLARTWVENLHATRTCSRTSVETGDRVTITVTVRNLGPLPVPWVLIEDVVPMLSDRDHRYRLKVHRRRLKIAMLGVGPASGQTKLQYDLEFLTRGYYQVGPLVLEGGDLFGLHRRYFVAALPSYVLVYPKVVPLEHYDLASRRPIGEMRLAHRLYEDPTRIAGVRPYEAGDPFSRIHWRATARTGALQSKVYEPSSLNGVTLLVDLHRASYPRQGEPVRSELAVTTAVSLANAVQLRGEQIGLITNGQDAAERIQVEGWATDYRSRQAALASAAQQAPSDQRRPLVVPTRRGPESYRALVETLARAELSDGLDFAQLVIEAGSRVPRDATVVAVLPGADEAAMMTLGNLRRRGHSVFVVLVRPDEDAARHAQAQLFAARIASTVVADEVSLARLCRQFVGA